MGFTSNLEFKLRSKKGYILQDIYVEDWGEDSCHIIVQLCLSSLGV